MSVRVGDSVPVALLQTLSVSVADTVPLLLPVLLAEGLPLSVPEVLPVTEGVRVPDEVAQPLAVAEALPVGRADTDVLALAEGQAVAAPAVADSVRVTAREAEPTAVTLLEALGLRLLLSVGEAERVRVTEGEALGQREALALAEALGWCDVKRVAVPNAALAVATGDSESCGLAVRHSNAGASSRTKKERIFLAMRRRSGQG